jgi:hypothetical protein
MRKPFEHTLTPADRIVFQKCLVRASVFYGSLTLLIIGFAIASHYGAINTQNDTAAISWGTHSDLACPDSRQAGNALCAPRNRESSP